MRPSKPAKALKTTVMAAVPKARPMRAVKDMRRIAPSLPREKKYFLAMNVENDGNRGLFNRAITFATEQAIDVLFVFEAIVRVDQ